MTLSSLLCVLLHVISLLYEANAFSMKMFPIDSHHLQILPKSFTKNDREHFFRDISLSRAFYANRNNADLGLDSIRTRTHVQSSYFVTQLNFGSENPPSSPILILDTSADQTWVQCDGCNPCFNLTTPLNVTSSKTYARIDTDDTRCIPKINYEGSCGFEAWLGSGHTQGFVGTDTFLFNDSSGYFPNIAFGCGVINNGFDFKNDPNNVIAGVHGLGIGPKSIMTQLDMDIKGRFTYCIRRDNGPSTLSFGDDAQITGGDGRNVQTIAMNPKARYHLFLAGITLDGKRLTINPSLFLLDDQDFTSGFFIDPSAPYTVLTNTAYQILRSELEKYFHKYQRYPARTKSNIFDLCYNNVLEGKEKYPAVTFHFVKSPGSTTGEIKLLFDSKNIFSNFGMTNGFCLQILPTPNGKDGPSIFGAYQQTNIQFLFDVKTRLLSFVPTECK